MKIKIIALGIVQRKDKIMTLQEILDRVQDILNQGIDGYQDLTGELDLLRHDLENEIISEELESLADNNPDDGSWVGR